MTAGSCPFCTCPLEDEHVHDMVFMNSNMIGKSSFKSGSSGFFCTGCGLKFKFLPPDSGILVVLGVMNS